MSTSPKQKTESRLASRPVDHYEALFFFNQHCREAVEIMLQLKQLKILTGRESAYYRTMIEEARAAISQSVAGLASGKEILAAAAAEQRRLRFERRFTEKPKRTGNS